MCIKTVVPRGVGAPKKEGTGHFFERVGGGLVLTFYVWSRVCVMCDGRNGLIVA